MAIRERFEIQALPTPWGRLPFLAVTDHLDGNLPRFEGRWSDAGARLCEHTLGWPQGLYLWCWENPEPDRVIERMARGTATSGFCASPAVTATASVPR